MDHMSVNGVPVLESHKLLSPLSWSCAYGYGIFETILISNGKPLFLRQHLKRMSESAGSFRLTMPQEELIIKWTSDLLRGKAIITGRLKITLLGEEKIVGENTLRTNTLLAVQAGSHYQPEMYLAGVEIGLLSLIKNERSILVRHKTLNYMENMLAREQAREQGWFEGLFLNNQGRVCEGTVSNVFVVKDKIIKTPGPEEGLLPGVTRQLIINLAEENNIPCEETCITPEDLAAAEEVFLTNSLMGVMPVCRVQGTKVGAGNPGKITVSLVNLYRELLVTEKL